MAKTKPAKETGLPVIIALVFFVVTTIGLGVFVYVLYSDQEGKDAEVDKSKKELANARSGMKEAQQIALVTRAWVGLADGTDIQDLAEIKEGDKAYAELKRLNDLLKKRAPDAAKSAADKFNESLAAFYGKDKDKKDIPKLDVSSLTDADLVFWPGDVDDKRQLKPPTRTMIDSFAKAFQYRDLAVKKANDDQAAYDNVMKLVNQTSEAYVKAKEEFAKKAIEMPKTLATHMEGLTKTTTDRFKGFEQMEKDSRKEVTTLKDGLDSKDASERKLKDEIKRLRETILSLQYRLKPTDPFQYDEPQGKVTGRPEPGVLEINLGSNANVRPGLTFTVLPRDFQEKGRQSRMRTLRQPDDRGVYKEIETFVPKATIEVTEVLGPELSRARITSEAQDIRDAVLTGDLLYNSAWRKGHADHIALVGIFDINGDGTDDIAGVVRDMNKMGVKVDAYLNLASKDLKWVGALTDQTRYVVEGYTPTPGLNDSNLNGKTRLIEAMKKAKDEGREKGISVVSFRDFFGRIGYRARMDVSEDRINQAAAPYLSGVNAPAEPPPAGN